MSRNRSLVPSFLIFSSLVTAGAVAHADTFTARCPVNSQVVSKPTMIGASLMGVEGFCGTLPPLASPVAELLAKCQAATVAGSGWELNCDPRGMTYAMNTLARQNWLLQTARFDQQYLALNTIVGALRSPQSPAVIPLWGRHDRWVAAYKVEARQIPPPNWFIDTLDARIAFPNADTVGSGGFTLSPNGVIIFGAASFLGQYVQFISLTPMIRHSGEYVVMWDPPVGVTAPEGPPAGGAYLFARASGLTKPGERMDASKAQHGVFDAMRLAGLGKRADLQRLFTEGTPDIAQRVQGRKPRGEDWAYYVVPIRDAQDNVLAMVQLSADDGSFEGVLVPDQPFSYQVVSLQQAEIAARSLLKAGESLKAGRLSYSASVKEAMSPHFPYYRFAVVDRAGREGAVVLVDPVSGRAFARAADEKTF